MINPLCIAPTLFNKIQFTVKFWQKNHIKTPCLAGLLKQRNNISKVRLIVKDLLAAAVCGVRFAFEILALCTKLKGIVEAPPMSILIRYSCIPFYFHFSFFLYIVSLPLHTHAPM